MHPCSSSFFPRFSCSLLPPPPKDPPAEKGSFLAKEEDVSRNAGHVTQKRTVRTVQTSGQQPVARKNATGTSGAVGEKETPSASPSLGFVTTGMTVRMVPTRWSAQELAFLRSSPAKMDSVFSQCGDAMEKVTVAMAATRKIVQLLTVSEGR